MPLGGRMVLGAPVIYGKNIFLTLMNETGRGRGVALALDSGVGKEIWRVETAAAFKNGPVIADGKLIGATVSGGIHAFQLENGIQLWDYQLGDPTERWLFSSPVNFGETVFAGPLMFFAAVNAKNGRELWARPDLFPKHSSDWISSPASPVADGERVYVGFLWTWGSIAALDRRTGKTLWHFEGRDHPVSPLVLDGKGALYLQSHTGHVLKIRTEDGALIWRSAKMNPWSPAKPLVWNDRVFVASGDGKVFALDEKDGRILWDWECRGGDLQGSHPYRRKGKALFSSPQIYQGSLLVGGTDGTLTRLDPENGKVLQSADLGIPITATPLVVNEKIFLPAGGKLLALEFPGF